MRKFEMSPQVNPILKDTLELLEIFRKKKNPFETKCKILLRCQKMKKQQRYYIKFMSKIKENSIGPLPQMQITIFTLWF
jgi:hypothetical protein